jgi:hypothetical protein
MSCLDPQSPKTPTIIIGEDKTLTVRLTDASTKLPFDISAASEIIAIFSKNDATTLEKKLSTGGISILSGPGGALQILLSAADTSSLMPSPAGGLSSVEIRITIAGKLTIILLENSISVISRLFPSV